MPSRPRAGREAERQAYARTDQVAVGNGLALPEPFGFELDTTDFV